MGYRETSGRHDHLLRELNEERAAALARISRTLESLVDQLGLLRARISTAEPSGKDLDTYRELRRQAVRYRWYLEVQREALGMRGHQFLDEFYAIPPDLTDTVQTS